MLNVNPQAANKCYPVLIVFRKILYKSATCMLLSTTKNVKMISVRKIEGPSCEDLMKIGWKCSIDGKCMQPW